MWGILRIILLIANAVFFAWLGYIVATDPEPATDPQFVLACGVLTLLALNFFYVLLANRPFNWRALHIDLDKISDAAKALMRREQDVERLCSSFGVALRYIGSHAPRENNQPMVSRDWALHRIHECILGSPCRWWPALNLGLRAISLMPHLVAHYKASGLLLD